MATEPKLKEFAKEILKGNDQTNAIKKVFPEIKDDNYAGVKGSRLIRNDKVREYLESRSEKAAIRVVELSEQEENLAVALGASKDILDRSGYKPVDKSLNLNIDMEVEVDEELVNEYEEKLRQKLNDTPI